MSYPLPQGSRSRRPMQPNPSRWERAHHALMAAPSRDSLLARWGLRREEAEAAQLGLDDGCLSIPFYALDGKALEGVKVRSLSAPHESGDRYRWADTGRAPALYTPPGTLDGPEVWLTEGPLKALGLSRILGRPVAALANGAKVGVSPEGRDLLRGKAVRYVADPDADGRAVPALLSRQLAGIGAELRAIAFPPEENLLLRGSPVGDPNDVLAVLGLDAEAHVPFLRRCLSERMGRAGDLLSAHTAGRAEVGDEAPVFLPREPLPILPPKAWRGLWAGWRDLLVSCTEAPPAMHFLTFTVVVGLLFRRRVWFNHPHPTFPNFYAGFIAPTGDPRKTTALAFGERLACDLGEHLNIIRGLSSPEGLLERMAAYREELDARGREHRVAIPAPAALLYCDEFGAVLAKTRQDGGGGLLPTLTRLYDGRAEDENPTRGRPIRVIEPTLGLLTGTTPEVLERGLRDDLLTDGFLNRMVWATSAEAAKPIADPRPPDQTGWNGLLKSIREALDRWPLAGQEIPLGTDAKTLWEEIYNEWFRERQGAASDLVQKATARTHLHIRKLAVLDAALEGKAAVGRGALEWAAEMGAYFEDVTRWLLQDAVLAPTRSAAVEQLVVRALQERAELPAERSTRALTKRLHRHADSGEVRRTLENLQRAGRVWCEPIRTERGQKTDRWTLIG